FYAAADPGIFSTQSDQEALQPWRVGKIFRNGASGEGQPGEQCASTYQPDEQSDYVFGVWSGHTSERNGGQTWAAIELQAQREYISQGWATFPDAPTDPAELECDFFTLIDSRVPFTAGNTDPSAILEGAVLPAQGGLPLGAEFFLTVDDFYVQAGAPVTVSATARSADGGPVEGTVELALPGGWTASGGGTLTAASDGSQSATTFIVTPDPAAEPDTRFRLDASLMTGDGTGATSDVIEVVPPVRGTLQALPEIEQFREWAQELEVAQLDALIKPRLSIVTGGTREIPIVLQNFGVEPQSGTVALELPAGFEATEGVQEFTDLSPGGNATISFTVTNSDANLPTANAGGEEGDYDFAVVTTVGQQASTRTAALNVVPTTSVPGVGAAAQASPVASPVASPAASPIASAGMPAVDGQIGQGEYPGEVLDLSRVWEGDDPDSAQDASGTAQLVWAEDGLYVAVSVTDESLGTVLPAADAKRHWRTDSVEIAIDPLGTAANTSSTFKVGLFPTTAEGAPAAYRDADARQGPISETAPGMQVASTLSDPYSGYVLETFIPFDALPGPIDPERMTLNIFIYDSDTQDKTGQSRLGWSTWQGVQGDTYRWGAVILEGYPRLEDAATAETADPAIPLDATLSTNSPQSILQSTEDGVPIAGKPPVPDGDGVAIAGLAYQADQQQVGAILSAGSAGTIHMFLLGADGAVLGDLVAEVRAGESPQVAIPAPADPAGGTVLVSFETTEGAVQVLSVTMPE
ncbi:MAG: hypothetical protein H0W06_02765, partial [Chloroflexia bacterium]|nr:hypothetical protein [Chloroflexia bacterium]